MINDRTISDSTAGPGAPFRHEAVFYEGAGEYAARLAGFVSDALSADEPVLVMIPPDRASILRAALGRDARRVAFEDMTRVGRNPARIIPAWREFAEANAAPGRRLRGIGEPIWSGRTAEELDEARRHEALLNIAFSDAPFWLVCPYDTETLDPHVLSEATRTHPHTVGPAPDYAGTPSQSDVFGGTLPPPPAEAIELHFSIREIRDVRPAAYNTAIRAGLTADGAHNFALAAHELAANSILHGGGDGLAHFWTEPSAVAAQIRDHGLIDSLLVGRIAPSTDLEGGRGVWLANQLCDLVRIRSDGGGTVVRIRSSA